MVRDGQEKTFEITPHYDAAEKRMLLGVAWETDSKWIRVSAGTAVSRAGDAMWEVVSRTASVFAHIFEAERRQEISSVVGISDVGHEVVSQGWRESFLLLALVSLSLAGAGCPPGSRLPEVVVGHRDTPRPFRIRRASGRHSASNASTRSADPDAAPACRRKPARSAPVDNFGHPSRD